jgi:uncharacterized DUF497 family protein
MLEWDEAKRLINIDKHRLDFRDAGLMFDGRAVLHIPALYKDEARYASISIIGEKFYTVIWTERQERRRIISFRRARDGEERAYRQLYG